MITPSFKSLEGKSTIATLVFCAITGYQLLTGNDSPIDQATLAKLLETAESAKEISAIYKEFAANNDVTSLGKSGGLLAFAYFVLQKFINSRTELKKLELELKMQELKSASGKEEIKNV